MMNCAILCSTAAIISDGNRVVKNYLVTAVRPITSGWHLEGNQDLYQNYQIMYRMMLASWQRFSHQEFEPVLLTGEVENNREYCIENWRALRELWLREPCNIVWAGADTIMVQPTELFGRFKEYRLFNFTEPRTHAAVRQYYNDDIQYFPHTMSEHTWAFGESLIPNMYTDPEGNWGYDQVRHNHMFWQECMAIDDRCHPDLAWQAMRMRSFDPHVVAWHERWNNCELSKARIIHFHASRGSDEVIEIMRQICDKLGIQYATHP